MSAPATAGTRPPPGDECLSVRAGRLLVEDVPARELARRFGTPLYVISERQLRLNAARWKAAAGGAWPHGPVLVMPSLKANTTLALRRILDQEGLGCDVFGPWELELALRAGTPPRLISLNGATKADGAIERAVSAGARVTLDSLDELQRTQRIAVRVGRDARVALRVRPWLPSTTTGSDFAPGVPAHLAVQDYRAGMTDEDVDACLDLFGNHPTGLTLVGIMAHVSRQTTELDFWRSYAREVGTRTAAAAAAIGGGWRPLEIDLGGGFALPRDPTGRVDPERAGAPPAPDAHAYCTALAAGLSDGLVQGGLDPAGITLQLEPGRAIYGNAGLHLSTVRHVKAQSRPVPRRWIETDTSETFLGDVNLEHSRFACVLADDADRPPRADTAVTGISCGFDVLVPDGHVPDARAGELLAFLDTGAYQDAAASNFNAMPRPATVLVSKRDARVVRRAESLDDLLAREVSS